MALVMITTVNDVLALYRINKWNVARQRKEIYHAMNGSEKLLCRGSFGEVYLTACSRCMLCFWLSGWPNK
jgi:hypothetical protein